MRVPTMKRSVSTYLTVDEDTVDRAAFLERTSIHGMKHLIMTNVIRRVFWMAAVTTASAFAIYLIAQVFIKVF
jgi:hypothetical protein